MIKLKNKRNYSLIKSNTAYLYDAKLKEVIAELGIEFQSIIKRLKKLKIVS